MTLMGVVVTVLIQADSLDFQAATATTLVSATMGTAGTGGLLRSLVPTHGGGHCTTTTTMSTEAAAIGSAASLLAASRIKI